MQCFGHMTFLRVTFSPYIQIKLSLESDQMKRQCRLFILKLPQYQILTALQPKEFTISQYLFFFFYLSFCLLWFLFFGQ